MPNASNLKRESMEKKGFFVCIEGLDGCGKTTQTRMLVKVLKENYDAVYTAEPTQGKVGRFIKENYLHCESRGSSIVEALLFAADRFEHMEYEVLPKLREGKLVISDRYVYSSLAYQGAAGLDLEWIKGINRHAMPADLAVFIDVEPETVVQRLKPEKSVMENLETQRKVREVYLRFAEKGELLKLDGNGSKKEVSDRLLSTVLEFLERAC